MVYGNFALGEVYVSPGGGVFVSSGEVVISSALSGHSSVAYIF